MCTDPCPYCRTGTVVVDNYLGEVSQSGFSEKVSFKQFRCDSCGSVVEDTKNLLKSHNDDVKLDFIKRVNKKHNNVFSIGGVGTAYYSPCYMNGSIVGFKKRVNKKHFSIEGVENDK
jgi:hypothetical protein